MARIDRGGRCSVTMSRMASWFGPGWNRVAIVACASVLAARCTGRSPGDIGDEPSELEAPATVSVVSVTDVDPGWPIGRWTSGPVSVSRVCNGTPSSVELGVDMTVRAGAGLDFVVTSPVLLPFQICEWNGVPSSDGHAIEGAGARCQYKLNGLIPATMTIESIALSLAGEDPTRRAWLFAVAKIDTTTESCTVTFEDVGLDLRSGGISKAAAGRHDETLSEPLVLKGWGEFAVTDVGTPIDPATFRRSLIAEAISPSPDGIVVDPNAYAIKAGSAPSSRFTVIVGVTNQGGAPVCLASAKVEGVTNAAGLAIGSVASSSLDAPRFSAEPCLRPAERAWIRAAVSTPGQADFENVSRARVSVLGQPVPGGQISATPLRVRHPPGRGLEIDFIGDPGYAAVYFLDGAGVPLGVAPSFSVFPADAVRPELATVTFPLHPVSGQPTRIQVFPAR